MFRIRRLVIYVLFFVGIYLVFAILDADKLAPVKENPTADYLSIIACIPAGVGVYVWVLYQDKLPPWLVASGVLAGLAFIIYGMVRCFVLGL